MVLLEPLVKLCHLESLVDKHADLVVRVHGLFGEVCLSVETGDDVDGRDVGMGLGHAG